MRKALCVGIDAYERSPLTGCVSDATRLGTLLKRHDDDSLNFDSRVLAGDGIAPQVSRDTFEESLQQLVRSPVTSAVLHFSGHGGFDPGGKPALVLQDGSHYRMSDLLESLSGSPSSQTVVLLDCCFSGGLGQAQFLPQDQGLIPEGVVLIVASGHDEFATEGALGGVFSSLVVGALDGGAADVRGRVTAAGIYAYVDEGLGGWEQRPAIRANINRLEPLRQCTPQVEDAVLRRLPEWFPDPDALFSLSPEFEPDASPPDPEREAVFALLQSCNRARLIDPVGAEHMYYAAMRSTGCRLTPLGLRYWRMAREDRL